MHAETFSKIPELFLYSPVGLVALNKTNNEKLKVFLTR